MSKKLGGQLLKLADGENFCYRNDKNAVIVAMLVRCVNHPYYVGVRAPRKDCSTCQLIYKNKFKDTLQVWNELSKVAELSDKATLKLIDHSTYPKIAFDDGSTFEVVAFAGGAAPNGLFSTLEAVRRFSNGDEEHFHYVRVPGRRFPESK